VPGRHSRHDAEPATPQLPERYGRNVAASYANTLVTALVALIVTPVLARGLGPEEYGIWVLVASFALYLELLEFGFGGATVKYVAEAWSRRDREALATAMATSFWILSASALVALAIGAGLAAAFPDLFGVSGDTARDAQLLVLLVLFELAVSIPLDTFGGALMALQRMDLLYGTLTAVTVAQAIAWSLVIALGGGLVELGVVTVVLGLSGQLARWLLARRQLGGSFISRRWFRRDRVRPLAGFSMWMSLNELSSIVVLRLDTVIVGVLLGVPEAGVYAVGQRLTRICSQAIVPLTAVFLPHASQLAARRDFTALRSSWLTGTRLSLGVAMPVCLTLALLAGPAVEAWVGAEFQEAESVVVLLAAAALVGGLSDVANLVLQGTGDPRTPAIARLVEAGINLSLSVVLGLTIGLEGVALATLVGVLVGQLLFFLPRACAALHVPMREFAATLVRPQAAPVAVAALVGAGCLELGVSGVFEVIAAGVAVMAAYTVVFALTGLSAAERASAWARLREASRRGKAVR
jgi:O-antigen/teichoic acid export membrane protein